MKPLPCIHLGEPVSSRCAAENGMSPARVWRRCLHPQQPMGLLVCRCKQCKRCPMYSPPEDDDGSIAADS